MERVLIICGSAGRGGTTEAMCQSAAAAFREAPSDALIVFPSEMEIRHCTGCDLCGSGRCVIDDDMSRLYKLFAESDLVILATPLHFNGPSSLMKTVMDRFQVYWRGSGLPHPKAAMGLICAGSDEPNFSPTLSIMRAFAATTGMKWVGEVCISGTDRDGDARVDEAVRAGVSGLIEKGIGISKSLMGDQTSCGGQ